MSLFRNSQLLKMWNTRKGHVKGTKIMKHHDFLQSICNKAQLVQVVLYFIKPAICVTVKMNVITFFSDIVFKLLYCWMFQSHYLISRFINMLIQNVIMVISMEFLKSIYPSNANNLRTEEVEIPSIIGTCKQIRTQTNN